MERLTWAPTGPIDLAASTARYTRWGNDPVNVVADGGFHRVSSDGHVYRVTAGTDGTITISGDGDLEAALVEVRHRFADALPRPAVEALGDRVPAIGIRLAEVPGYRPPMSTNPFEALIGSIAAQQVNLRWALTTRRRLVEAFGRAVQHADLVVWQFPDPEPIAATDPSVFRSMQFTTRKAEFIVAVAQAAVRGDLDGLAEASAETVIERLTAIRGIGLWSAEWFLARCLARPDAVAAGDLGVRKAISRFVVDTDEVIPEADVRAVVEGWGDGANWGTHLLLEGLPG